LSVGIRGAVRGLEPDIVATMISPKELHARSILALQPLKT
jgi:hypothetical protein